ncbi:hypothetical protein LSAT2_024215 [Lamellibrachia satsuma]|nr:hypothetical protein LSAT2_024215 [Lamellibrachia satsuma]
MFNVYLGLILFSIQSTDVAASNVLHKPRNGFVTVGDSTTVICESDDPNDEIQLYSGGVIDKKLVGEQIGYVNSNEVVVTHSKGYRYKVTRMLTTNTIKMTIEIASVSILDKIGFYCWTKLNHTVFVATYFIYDYAIPDTMGFEFK